VLLCLRKDQVSVDQRASLVEYHISLEEARTKCQQQEEIGARLTGYGVISIDLYR